MNVGFIGCGKIALHHAEVLKHLGVKVSAIAASAVSKHRENFLKRYPNTNAYTDWQTMIGNERLDAIFVLVSWDQVNAVAREVLEIELPCFIEKPVGLSVNEVEALLLAYERRQSSIQIGYNRRFYDFIPVLEKTLAVKDQNLLSVDVILAEPTLKYQNWPNYELLEKRIVHYSSSHTLDLLRYLLGSLTLQYVRKTNQSCTAVLETGSNIPIQLSILKNAPRKTSVTFNFRECCTVLSPLEELRIYNRLDCIEERGSRRYEPHLAECLKVDSQFKAGFLAQARYFIDQTCKNRTGPGSTLKQALELTQLCDLLAF